MPTGLVLRAAAFRSALAAMRSVIVIDNASNAAQVESLLPGSSEAVVLITSWAPIAELPAIRTMPLHPLDNYDALAMLQAVTRREINEADLPTVRDVARLVGNLPLALRIAGGLLKARPHWSWGDLLRRLGDQSEASRLDKLKSGPLEVRATFGLAYSELDPATARGYRLLGMAPASAMSSELAQLLVSANPDEGEDVFDQLISRELLRPETSSTVRMHALLWLNARELVNSSEDSPVRQAAIDRMIGWSLHRLETHYLPRLRQTLNLLPSFNASDGSSLALSEVYVDSGVIDEDAPGSMVRLADVFPARRRLVLVAPGGTGKTTLANHLCDAAAALRAEGGSGPLPLMVLVRDLRPEDQAGGLEPVIVRLLRHRYEVDLAPEALQVALQQGLVFLVLDGLDELVDPSMRSDVLGAIARFSQVYPRAPMLITTRPYPAVRRDLPEFAAAHIVPWTQEMVRQYLANLTYSQMGPFDDQYIEGLRNWVASHSALGVMTTPLGLQMLASVFYRADDIPRSFTFLVQNIVVTVISRELARGTLYLADYELLGLLELIAFAMQSSSYIRTIIDQNAILTIVKQSDYYKKERPDSQLIRDLTSRSLLFQETGITQDGDSLFAFAHTAFREYFAASYLAKMSPQNFVETIAEHLSDASWEAVALSALELSQRQQGERFLDDIVRSAGQRGDPQLTNALRSWSQRVSGA
jgi:hypothetical protein